MAVRTKKAQGIRKLINKVIELNLTASVIILNLTDLMSVTKREHHIGWKCQEATMCSLAKIYF